MRKKISISIVLLILLSTITFKQKIGISKFNLEEIKIVNNFLIEEKDIKKNLIPFYQKNLLLIDNKKIEKVLMQNSYIESFIIKKKYPNKMEIKIFEKIPIAILQNKKKKFYLSEKIDLIEFTKLKEFKDLPYVFGDEKNFKTFYEELKKMNFPFFLAKKYTFYESKRWDIETTDKKTIKLPSFNYTESLRNYLKIKDDSAFNKYKVFDYRIQNQLILK